MEQRISVITLGVADLARATAFYEALGWARAGESQDGITFFQLAGQVLALYPAGMLAADTGRPVSDPGAGSGAITLAQNMRTRGEVAAAAEAAVSAGGTRLRAPYDTPWGGHVAYVADPDGHVWEFAHVPMFPLAPDGTLTLPGTISAG